jgi:BolA protein
MPTRSRADHIRARLQFALDAEHIQVVDESHLHAGHAGARPGGESHFRLLIVSGRFAGKGQVERQRMVYSLLSDLMEGEIHALAMQTLTPEEWRAR